MEKYQQHYGHRTFKQKLLCNDAQVRTWAATFAEDKEVKSMMNNFEHPVRVTVDIFLMESLVYEFVRKSNSKGIAVPSNTVIAKYIKGWTYRYTPARVKSLLEELKSEDKRRKEWLRRFRARWGIAWGTLRRGKPLTRAELQAKVCRHPFTDGTASKLINLRTTCSIGQGLCEWMSAAGCYVYPVGEILERKSIQ